MTIDISLRESQEGYETALNLLDSVSDEDIRAWTDPENLRAKTTRTFAGFEITDSIDGDPSDMREVSLVRLLDSNVYPQHVHRDSDTLFIIIGGQAYLLRGPTKMHIRSGMRLSIPRGVPHGFQPTDGEPLVFISVQQPPIRNRETGEEDLTLVDQGARLISMV
jgi:mannose-6-phosphate isomerase-like protein (cupin superfamily)